MPIPMPAVGLSGLFEVKSPYALKNDTVYTCKANVSFEVLEISNVNIFKTYYEPKKISEDQYKKDRENGAVITTLTSSSDGSVVLPSSFIKSFPNKATVPLNRFIITGTFTAPDTIGIAGLESDLSRVLEERLGIQVETKTYRSPTSGVMTTEDAKIFESNRQAAITNRDTVTAENIRLKQKNKELEKTNRALAAMLDVKK